MNNRQRIAQARRWVIKIGSALLTNDGRGLDSRAISAWVEQMVALRGAGVELVLVSSGAVAEGMKRLGWARRPNAVLELGVVPVINENDTVATDEIRVGDNDTLAALVTNLVEAELLVILTDQSGMFDSDPRKNSSAKLISEAYAGDANLEAMAGGGGGVLGRGGMLTKVQAARRAARSGAATLIVSGREPNILQRLAQGE